MNCSLVQFFILSLFCSVCWSYRLIITQALPHGVCVFKFDNAASRTFDERYSISLRYSSEYHIRVPFEFDEQRGCLIYIPKDTFYQQSEIDKQYKFNITLTKKNFQETFNYPFEIISISENAWLKLVHFGSTSSHKYSSTTAEVDAPIRSIVNLFKFGHCPNMVLPEQICGCQIKNELTVSTETALDMHQTISNCTASHVYIPNQSVTVKVRHALRQPKDSHDQQTLHRTKRSQNFIHFNATMYSVHVKENLPGNFLVTTIQVFDTAGKVASHVTYSLYAMANRKSLEMFDINQSTGKVSTKLSLDREKFQRHKFRVTAVQQNSNQAQCILNIVVDDENDNNPIFEQPQGYVVSVQENQPLQTRVLRVTAYDMDSGENGRISYYIQNSIPANGRRVFGIREDGIIEVKGELDREVQRQYQLTIVAKDNGRLSKSNSVNVEINIDDENDNSPQFTKSQYDINVHENVEIGEEIGKVAATDKDSGSNGVVTYSVLRGNNKFAIDSKSGAISVRSKLDFEEAFDTYRGVYTLKIRASDGGGRSNNSGLVKIHVLDVNDNTPQFYQTPYHFFVSESAGINTRIGQVEASDQDHGENAKITYTMQYATRNRARPPFRVDSRTGIIKVIRPLDHEKQTRYEFTIRASDNGKPRRSVGTAVIVDVRDVNDNAPQFNASRYFARISEDKSIGSDIVVIKADDPDKDVTVGISFMIADGDSGKKFSITTRGGTGVIKLNKRLDYNQQRTYTLNVTASDGTLTNSTSVFIEITDTNSHQPIFDKSSYPVLIKEDAALGSLVVNVHATDNDVGDNARITYCFTDQIRNFKIDAETGNITVARKLDYETQHTISLSVRAHDNGLPQRDDITEVIINLQDTNDNTPKFERKKYNGSVSEDVNLYTLVLSIHANDADSGLNKQIRYTFENGNDGNGDFSIDSSTGAIRTAHLLDRESVSQYRLIAYAVDRGVPALSSSVVIFIKVLDVDDNAPRFENDTLVYRVREDVSLQHVIATIQATDPDLTYFPITYDLGHDAEILRHWHLDPRTGVLKTLHKLDYETKQNFTLTVTALSHDLVNQATVLILVEDCNDNWPVIDHFEIVFNNYITRMGNSFPTGVIGKVPAYDPDVSDKLTYRFTSGSSGNLLLMNRRTGELSLNSTLDDSNRRFVTVMRVEVSDGKHKREANCTLKVTGITEEMLQHSITVRVLHMNAYKFLSPVMYQFIDGLAQILNITANNIYVFNVQNDTDVDREVLNVSFSAREERSNFFTSKYLQDQVYLNRQTLANITDKTVLPFDDNICLREPCQNYKRCTSVLTFNSTAPFVSSKVMIFRPIYPVYKLKCECPIGFTNDETCSDEVDLCFSSPCRNGGRCLPKEGGYACVCKDGFTGDKCEINLKVGQCDAHPSICQNGGRCTDTEDGHFRCDCSSLQVHPTSVTEVSPFCHLLARHFKPGDYLTLPGITKQWHFTLSISFSTVDRNGLLFYNGRLNHEHDFMSLELVNGQAQLNFSTGEEWTVVDPFVEGGLNDGQWHTIEMKYYNEPKPEPLPHGVLNREGPSSTKIVILTIDPSTCDPVVASHWNPAYGDYTCSKKVNQTSSKHSLDLTSPLLLGGVPDLPEDYQVHSKSYSGCLRNLVIDGKGVDLGHFIANNGSSPGCPPMRSRCSSKTCFHDGQCLPRWKDYNCACGDGFTGRRCEHKSSFVGQLNGTGCLSYGAVDDIRVFTIPWHQEISFRTSSRNAVLLHVVIGIGGALKTTTKISNGRIVYDVIRYTVRTRTSTSQQLSLTRTDVSDGEWHELAVDWDWTVPKTTQVRVTLSLDQGREVSFVDSSSTSLNHMEITSLYVGGEVTAGQRIQWPFNGCLQNLQIGPKNQKHRLAKDKLHVIGGAKFADDCTPKRTCLSRSHPCPRHSRCIDGWSTHKCQCDLGYVGSGCVSICSLNVCENNSTCEVGKLYKNGYRCNCLVGFIGETCGKPYTETCPPGWFGTGTCAPCDCSTDKNYDTTCDRETGKCLCKKHHYFVEATQSCEPCNCYSLGSETLACNNKTGQCLCKPSVIGKQCNLCSSAFAEITNTGCTVRYEKECPRSFFEGLLWERVDYNMRRPMKCPGQTEGFVTRKCDPKLGWLAPDYSQCTSVVFGRFGAETEKISGGDVPLTFQRCIQLSYNLTHTCATIPFVYKNDVLNTYMLTMEILEFESKQTAFGLASFHDSQFTDNLANVSSTLLNDNLIPFWRGGGGSNHTRSKRSTRSDITLSAPLLVRSWERYISTFLKNLNQIYYRTVVINTPNINIKAWAVPTGSVLSDGFSFSNTFSPDKNAPDVTVVLPQYLFTRERTAAANSSFRNAPAAVGMVAYRNIEQAFPESFADDRTFRIPRKPTINSEIVSVQAYKNTGEKRSGMFHKLNDPVVIHFRLLSTKAIEPQCVFWNFTAKSSGSTVGGWSHTGCTREAYNHTHVECHCYHLTTFAVVTDEEILSASSQLPVIVVMALCVAMSSFLLLIHVVASFFLPDVSSVRAVVNRNLSIAIIMANLLYVIGIQQTSNIYSCMAIAVGLHFLLMTTFAWMFVDGLHLYRKLTELRDVNRGHTRVYYIVGWILPAIVTALSVGLDAKGYGNTSFCWIAMDDVLIWSFAGPVLLCCVAYIVLFIMSIHAFLSSKRVDIKRKEVSFEMRASFFISPIIMCTWAFATLAANLNAPVYFYLFALTNVIQGVVIFLFHCLFSKEIRRGYRKYQQRAATRTKLNTTAQHLLQSSIGITPESSTRGAPPRYNHSTSESLSMKNMQESPMLPRRYDSDSEASDSYDDDSSDSSMSLGSSSEDNQVEINTYRNIRNTRPDYQPPKPKNSLTVVQAKGNGKLPNGSNGCSRLESVNTKKHWISEKHSDGSLSDGSNETSV